MSDDVDKMDLSECGNDVDKKGLRGDDVDKKGLRGDDVDKKGLSE